MSSSSEDQTVKVETFEEYFGGVQEVKKYLSDCQSCGAKLIKTHLSDYSNLIVQENSRCPDCGHDNRKVIHVLN